MAVSKKDLRKMFPNLYRELEGGENQVPIEGVCENAEAVEREACECEKVHQHEIEKTTQRIQMPDKLRSFNPEAVDFLRRCDTVEQAEEIISYLQKKGEITQEYAEELRSQLRRDGVRSFGSKKEENYYFHQAGMY
ncbi:DUF2095 family protein [Candidatus Bathycorpusculum sp.]|jgi:hypothetical protein|uniref:DUF2095 family protein n=1 Tax=Candidatus Bathycorpusculum sp. TaxID=2994959 RepID=UPI002839D071|nr:DUF2095 family protein [Candidatus Termitimicrobium sp.]MCL2685337.1 DUF2095 family protein [Candidatus Termitimicrobium sp.]